MSKFLAALNQIEQEKSAQDVHLVSNNPPKKSSFDWLWRFIFPALLITSLLAGAYIFWKYQPQPNSFFTIQLVTYQSESLAKEQAAKLATEGHSAFVITDGGYFQVCLGKFANQNLADEERTKLKNTLTDYKGMYVRFIHQ